MLHTSKGKFMAGVLLATAIAPIAKMQTNDTNELAVDIDNPIENARTVVNDDTLTLESSSTGTNHIQEVIIVPETPTIEIGTRANPVPLGECLDVEYLDLQSGLLKINITINKVVRGECAWNILKEEDPFNPVPKEGFEYIMPNVTLELVSIGEREPYSMSYWGFNIANEYGELYNEQETLIVSHELEQSMYEGDSITGNFAREISINDEKPLMSVNDMWFSLTE